MRKYLLNNKKVCLVETYDGSALFITSYIMQILFQFLLNIVLISTKVAEEFTHTLAFSCILTVLNESAMLITPFIYSKIKGENLFKASGISKGISPIQILMLVGIGIVTVMAVAPIANGFVRLVELSGYNMENIAVLMMDSWQTYIISVFILAMLPAFCEEFLYRGMIARSFGDKGVIFGIFVSAAFFAFMHGNPVQLVHQFAIGVVCATAYFLTRSIWAGFVIHFTNNFIALTGNFVLNQTGNPGYMPPIWISIVSCIVGFALLFGAFVLFYNYTKNKRGDKAYNSGIFQGMPHQFNYMRLTEDERKVIDNENVVRAQQLEECDSEQMQEVMQSALKEQKGKIDKRSRNSLIYAAILALAVWLLNTIMGYLK